MSHPRPTGVVERGRRQHLAVVGGGASTVCLLDALAEADGPPGDITVFENSPHLWRGRPFQADLDTVRVNIPPEGMSIRFGDNTLFTGWLADRDRVRAAVTGAGPDHVDELCGLRFVPRALFGDYLEESAHAILVRLLEQGWCVELVREPIAAIGPEGTGLRLRTPLGHEFRADRAVLCVGRGKPPDSYGLTGVDGFLPDPYPLAVTLAGIDPDAAVGVLGSGLTGVDVALSLHARGHRGPIHLLSRSGMLPLVRQYPVDHEFRHFTAARFRAVAAAGQRSSLAELTAVMRAELAEVGEDLDQTFAEIAGWEHADPLEMLRRNLDNVRSTHRAVRVLQKAVPAAGPDVWPLLSGAEQDLVLERYYRILLSLCCPMPPTSARTLLGLIDSGQLRLAPGLRGITPVPGGFTLRRDAGESRVQVVVNALNVANRRIPPKAAGLVDSMVESGLAERNHRGGLHVERATSRLTVAGRPDSRLYALGDLAAGSLLFTFGLPSLVDRAHDIATTLAEHAGADAALLQNA